MSEQITLTVNGAEHTLEMEQRRLLVHVLREDLGLTGTHIGCDTSSSLSSSPTGRRSKGTPGGTGRISRRATRQDSATSTRQRQAHT